MTAKKNACELASEEKIVEIIKRIIADNPNLEGKVEWDISPTHITLYYLTDFNPDDPNEPPLREGFKISRGYFLKKNLTPDS